MIGKLSERLTAALINRQQIDKGDAALYEYGLFILLSNLFFVCIVCLAGAVCHVLLQSLIFYIAFRCIRRYAGGYHAHTELRCQFFSTISIVGCVLIIKLLQQKHLLILLIFLTILSTITIAIFAPLDTPSKPLSHNEKKHYKKKSIVTLLALDIAFAISLCLQWDFMDTPIAVAVCLESILISLGKTQSYIQRKKLKM